MLEPFSCPANAENIVIDKASEKNLFDLQINKFTHNMKETVLINIV